MNSAEYSSSVVTPEAGLEINDQTERNDEIEYSGTGDNTTEEATFQA